MLVGASGSDTVGADVSTVDPSLLSGSDGSVGSGSVSVGAGAVVRVPGDDDEEDGGAVVAADVVRFVWLA